jgi:hypothetical protein
MTLLAVGLAALAGTALLAERTFAGAAGREAAVRAASTVIDSLLAEPHARAGRRGFGAVTAVWDVAADAHTRTIDVAVHVHRSGAAYTFRALQPRGTDDVP